MVISTVEDWAERELRPAVLRTERERLAAKVAAGEALAALTRALVVARAGRGPAGDDTARLHARSGLFVLVQAQSADVRAAQPAELAH